MGRITQCDKILGAIRANGSVTSREMIDMGIFKYSSRIADLRAKGYVIRATRVRGTLYRYTLEGEPETQTTKELEEDIQQTLGIVAERKFRML